MRGEFEFFNARVILGLDSQRREFFMKNPDKTACSTGQDGDDHGYFLPKAPGQNLLIDRGVHWGGVTGADVSFFELRAALEFLTQQQTERLRKAGLLQFT